MNIWVKQLTDSGSLFQYILSTRNRTLTNVTDDSIFYPNQVSCSPGLIQRSSLRSALARGPPAQALGSRAH